MYPFALPLSQSITALGARASILVPTVGHPCENPVPGAEECTTMYPYGIHVLVWEVEMIASLPVLTMAGALRRSGEGPSSCCFTFQLYLLSIEAVPAKYGLDSYITGSFSPSVSVCCGRVTSTCILSFLPSPSVSNSVSTHRCCFIHSSGFSNAGIFCASPFTITGTTVGVCSVSAGFVSVTWAMVLSCRRRKADRVSKATLFIGVLFKLRN